MSAISASEAQQGGEPDTERDLGNLAVESGADVHLENGDIETATDGSNRHSHDTGTASAHAPPDVSTSDGTHAAREGSPAMESFADVQIENHKSPADGINLVSTRTVCAHTPVGVNSSHVQAPETSRDLGTDAARDGSPAVESFAHVQKENLEYPTDRSNLDNHGSRAVDVHIPLDVSSSHGQAFGTGSDPGVHTDVPIIGLESHDVETPTTGITKESTEWSVRNVSPPVRLRMQSVDKLCARSMVVEWENGTDVRQKWVSSEDPLQNGWFQTEKILPPTSTNITVKFYVKALHKRYEVCMVDRRDDCTWVRPGRNRYTPEVICFRVGAGHFADPIDAVFELKGPMHRCFVHRAMNAANPGESEEWEYWEDQETRPPTEGTPATLVAADAAAIPQACVDLNAYVELVTVRLCAAAMELLDVHRQTRRALGALDAQCNGQWLRGNVATTASAGLLVGAFPLMFVVPPVGLGLAIVGGVAGASAMGGGALGEKWSLAKLNEQLSRDGWNAYVVAELLREWLHARKAMGKGPVAEQDAVDDGQVQPESTYTTMAKSTAYGIAMSADEAAIALPILGPVGIGVAAVLTAGIAIHGWTSRKYSQKQVRAKISELKCRLLFYQFLLARLGELTCPICLETLSEKGRAKHCEDHLHYCHSSCAQTMPGDMLCSICGSPLAEDDSTLEVDATNSGEDVMRISSDLCENASLPENSVDDSTSDDIDVTSGAFKESDVLEMKGRLDVIAQVMSRPPEGCDQVREVTAELRRYNDAVPGLETFAIAAIERPNGEDLFVQIVDVVELIANLSDAHETWAPPELLVSAEEEFCDKTPLIPQTSSGQTCGVAEDAASHRLQQKGTASQSRTSTMSSFRSTVSAASSVLSKARGAASYGASTMTSATSGLLEKGSSTFAPARRWKANTRQGEAKD